MKNYILKNFNYLIVTLFIFLKVSYSNAVEKPDFSELAEELIPSVVSVSVMISRESVNQPRAPQFPPGSPFEDFFKDFFACLLTFF